jgi:hypothetical protein
MVPKLPIDFHPFHYIIIAPSRKTEAPPVTGSQENDLPGTMPRLPAIPFSPLITPVAG